MFCGPIIHSCGIRIICTLQSRTNGIPRPLNLLLPQILDVWHQTFVYYGLSFIFVESTHHIHEHVARHLVDFGVAKPGHSSFGFGIILAGEEISVFDAFCDFIRNLLTLFNKAVLLQPLMLDCTTGSRVLILVLFYLF